MVKNYIDLVYFKDNNDKAALCLHYAVMRTIIALKQGVKKDQNNAEAKLNGRFHRSTLNYQKESVL